MNKVKYYCDLITKSRGHGAMDNFQRKIRFVFRTIFCLPYSLKIINFVYNHKFLSEKVFDYPIILSKMFRPYLSNLFTTKERYYYLIDNYKFIDKNFSQFIVEKLYKEGSIKLAEIIGKGDEKLEIFLSLYPKFDKEGDIEIKIVNSENISLAKITFSFIKYEEKDTLFIGGIQGPKKDVDKDLIKRVTKIMYGAFPKRILIEVLYGIIENLNINIRKICVGNTTHMYLSKRYIKRKTINADYDKFIESLNGKKLENALWELPKELYRKEIEEVSSKKRSEYKKRYEIFNKLRADIAKVL